MSEIADRIHALRNPEPVQEAAPEPVETPSEPVSEAPEPVVSEAPEVKAEPVEAPVAEAPDDDGETIEVETLSDLAEHFGIDPADLYNLKVPVSMADGSRAEVSLGEWKDSYKASQEAAQEARRAAEQRQALEAKQQALETEWRQRIEDTAASLQVAEQAMLSEFNGINWDQLRQEDPAEWSARRQLFNERNSQLQQAKREIAERWQQHEAATKQQQQQQTAERLETERKALLQALPQWANEETAQAERSALANYLGSNGFSQDEVNNVSDHRLVVMARKAMLYDKEVGKADAAKKRVVKIGKRTTAPGTARSKATAREDRDASLKRSLKKSGSVEDAAALIRSRMRG